MGTFSPETQVHEQGGRVLQREVTQAVRVLELVHQPANQIVLDHGRLLAPPNDAVTVRRVRATTDEDGGTHRDKALIQCFTFIATGSTVGLHKGTTENKVAYQTHP